MRSRTIVGSLVLVAGFTLGMAATRTAADPVLKWAAVNLKNTTVIAGAFVSGPVVFVHDDAKMARGGGVHQRASLRAGQGCGRGARRLPLQATLDQSPRQLHERGGVAG